MRTLSNLWVEELAIVELWEHRGAQGEKVLEQCHPDDSGGPVGQSGTPDHTLALPFSSGALEKWLLWDLHHFPCAEGVGPRHRG